MRRTYAALLCFVWLLGIEVLPNVHLAQHDRPHTHAADGTVIVVTFDRDVEPHRHADGTFHSHAAIEASAAGENAAASEKAASIEHARAHRDRRSRRGVLAIEHAPDTHAATGLAHHAAAIHAAVSPIVDAAPIDRVESDARYPETGRDVVALIATRDARGPPST